MFRLAVVAEEAVVGEEAVEEATGEPLVYANVIQDSPSGDTQNDDSGGSKLDSGKPPRNGLCLSS